MAEELQPLLQEKMDIPQGLLTPDASPEWGFTNTTQASFTLAKRDSRGRKLPQAIAHRGYKVAFPENTMRAFQGAVAVGAHAIETDLHISKDGVIVISHVRQCFQALPRYT